MISVALFQLPKVVKFSVAHLQTSERDQNWTVVNIRNRIACMMVQWFKSLAQNIGWDEIVSTEGAHWEVLPKKSSCSFGFCPIEVGGGKALPKFFVHFSQTVYIGSIWGWGGRGRPLPISFGHIGDQKKWFKLFKLGGGGDRGNLDKIQKNSYFFSGNTPWKQFTSCWSFFF